MKRAVVVCCCVYSDGDHLDLHVLTHSFPTRRASDLDGRPGALRVQATGKLHRLTKVPVPVQRIRAGEVINDSDLNFVTMRIDQVDRAALLDPEKIVGMSPRRVLIEGDRKSVV